MGEQSMTTRYPYKTGLTKAKESLMTTTTSNYKARRGIKSLLGATRALIAAKHFTGKEVAEASGISRPVAYRIIKGQTITCSLKTEARLRDWVAANTVEPPKQIELNYTPPPTINVPVNTPVVRVEDIIQERDDALNTLMEKEAEYAGVIIREATWENKIFMLEQSVTFHSELAEARLKEVNKLTHQRDKLLDIL
jgi:hypothetical protein